MIPIILFLFVFWLILNGALRWDVLWTGAVVAAAVFFFACKFLDWSARRERRLYCSLPHALAFVALMLAEIVKANVAVLKIMRHGKQKPVICKFKTGLKTRMGRVLLANAISITPGTVTIGCVGDELTVHCLDESLAGGLADSEMERKIARMEGTLHG